MFIYLILYFLIVPDREDKAFFQDRELPLVIAHQGGNLLSPSSTIVGFDKAVELGVDVLEYDIHITKDGHLVLIHDPTVDPTTNGTGKVEDLTLEELQVLDAGYTFKDLEGNYSYRGKGVYIPTLEEVFQRYGDILHNIEIKDDNPIEREEEIVEKLWGLIQKYKLEDKVLIASFDQELIDKFKNLAKEKVAVSGGKSEVTRFVILNKFFMAPFYKPTVDAVQIPTESSGFDLKTKNIIKGTGRLNLHLHYWTINDEETMRELIELGASGWIITDRPDILMEVVKEYKNK
jgi:glycerophosphoryl diester phosphodiesterase